MDLSGPQRYSLGSGSFLSVLFVWVLQFQDLVKITVHGSFGGTAMVSLYIEITFDVQTALIKSGKMDEVTDKRDNSNTVYSSRHI